ncbi:MAG: ABC transporter ATP-binding protein [Nitrospirae bacterium]|nr:ABC transporter ATP-binding protein [Nitrospirota bacterium]
MSNILIRAEGLSKLYVMGEYVRYRALRDTLAGAARGWLERFGGGAGSADAAPLKEIWALRDVSFDVHEGEVLGVVGRNGAGKSTLLKLLARITEPTRGCVTVRGRVGSLLEVGTGFHPELTGRENIFLSGAVLGMRRLEIASKLDDIVSFAEIGAFLDTPVKRYSSGMYVRLAFSVAAHLEPEILLVDEVLAVGDTAFQKKCIGRMGEVTRQGRTVVFVSHNMGAVTALCTQALVLTRGRMSVSPTDVAMAVRAYAGQVEDLAAGTLRDRTDRKGQGRLRIVAFEAVSAAGTRGDGLLPGVDAEFRIQYEADQPADLADLTAAITLTSTQGAAVAMLGNNLTEQGLGVVPKRGTLVCRVPRLPLAPGRYFLNLILRQKNVVEDWIQEAALISVEDGDFYGTGRLTPPTHGGVFLEQRWSVVPTQAS